MIEQTLHMCYRKKARQNTGKVRTPLPAGLGTVRSAEGIGYFKACLLKPQASPSGEQTSYGETVGETVATDFLNHIRASELNPRTAALGRGAQKGPSFCPVDLSGVPLAPILGQGLCRFISYYYCVCGVGVMCMCALQGKITRGSVIQKDNAFPPKSICIFFQIPWEIKRCQ